MPTVDDNRLKGNYGSAYVSARLSSECLVRPVAAETDVGVDLYCETIQDGRPFVHFWVQVKAGKIHLKEDRSAASCSFDVHHLQYWSRQPVPVFAALVPTDWPVKEDPNVFIIDITSQLLHGFDENPKTVTFHSDQVWQASDRECVKQFLEHWVPAAAARLQCRNGIVAPMPTVCPSYEIATPAVPVKKFKQAILDQIRRTAALSILFLHEQREMRSDTTCFRQTLASIVEQFSNDPHWENSMALALSHHADMAFDRAAEFYTKAIKSIEGDPIVSKLESWKKKLHEIQSLRECAQNGQMLRATVDCGVGPSL